MRMAWMIFLDSTVQALQQLWANRLRTSLSLLGVAIGIYCIIVVLAAVDSLESDIRGSFDKLGGDVVYISKMPWNEDPNRSYWKYQRRPNPSGDDFEALQRRLTNAKYVAMSYFMGQTTAKYESNAVNGAYMFAATQDYAQIYNIDIRAGRYFSSYELKRGSDCVVIGHEVADALFGKIQAVGKYIRVKGRKLKVVGVINKSGDDLINPLDYDWCLLIPYELGNRIAYLQSPRQSAMVIAMPNEGIEQEAFKDEIISVLRSGRQLRPKEENDFSLNSISIIASLLDRFFSTLNLIGWIIGGFALLVGAFSVANIMFVSVRERTGQIGVKKALGARSSVIMLEFLIEAVLTCIIGGLIGLLFVLLTTLGLDYALDSFNFVLSLKNVVFGILISTVIGVISGVLPAYFAARMDPVVAIRK